MWAKCHQIGETSPKRLVYEANKKLYLHTRVDLLLHLMPAKLRAEIEDEQKDYLIMKTEYAVFQDKYYHKIVGIDYNALYHKIQEKMRKSGLTEE